MFLNFAAYRLELNDNKRRMFVILVKPSEEFTLFIAFCFESRIRPVIIKELSG